MQRERHVVRLPLPSARQPVAEAAFDAGMSAKEAADLDQPRKLERSSTSRVAVEDPAVGLAAPGVGHAAGRWTAIPLPGTVVGVGLVAALVLHYGWSGLVNELAVAGWGLLLLAAYHLTSIAADAIAWRTLLPKDERCSLAVFSWARWIGEAVNGLLPVMQLGGNVVRARILARRGVSGTGAAASVVVDITVEASTQVVFALLGVIALAGEAEGKRFIVPLLVGAGVMGMLVVAFLLVQRAGIFGAALRALRRIAGSDRWLSLTERADDIDSRIGSLYGDRSALARGAAWHLAGWLLGAGEVWIALRILGHPVNIASAVALEGLGSAVRGAAFAVPGALGVQEGSLVLLGGILGLDPHTCLALSLSKRARELVLGIPALVAWQMDGGSRSLADGRPAR